MDEKKGREKNKKEPIDKSQEHLDYAYIEELRRQAWADPEVKKNWAEFDRKQKENQ